MGGAESTNTSTTLVNDLVTILNDSSQDCWTSLSGSNTIDLSHLDGVTVTDIQQDIVMQVDINCVETSTVNNATTQKLIDQAQSYATTESKGWGMNTADATNLEELCVKMSDNITNVYNQQLASYSTVNNLISAEYITDSSISAVNQSIAIQTTIEGIMKNDTINTIAVEIDNIVDQYAESKKKQSLGILLLIIGIVFIFIFFFFGIVSSAIANPGFWFMIFSIGLTVSAAFIVGYFLDWWPYEEITEEDTDQSTAEKEDGNKSKLDVSIVITAIFAAADVGAVIWAIMRSSKKHSGGGGGGGSGNVTYTQAPAPQSKTQRQMEIAQTLLPMVAML